jgi:hypothetical protein
MVQGIMHVADGCGAVVECRDMHDDSMQPPSVPATCATSSLRRSVVACLPSHMPVPAHHQHCCELPLLPPQTLQEVSGSQAALQVLLQSQDYGSCLELLENLQHALAGPQLSGLSCVRKQPNRVNEMIGQVQGLLAAELLQVAALPEPSALVAAVATEALITSTAEEEQAAAAARLSGSGSTSQQQNGQHRRVSSNGSSVSTAALEAQEQIANGSAAGALGSSVLLDTPRDQLHDQLLSLVIGLFRSDQLGHVLLQYK